MNGKVKTKCAFCKKEIVRWRCNIKRYKDSFCSRKCHSEWQKINLQREENPNWKGGRYETEAGYIMIYCPRHPRANNWGYVYEHIIVAERKYGVSTKKQYIHHLNGIKDDNRPENLVIVDPKNHDCYSVRHALQERIRELEKGLA